MAMQRSTLSLLALAAALPAAWARPAQAKDVFYHLGNGAVQVIDGDTDTVTATIPIRGWSRESAFTADKKFMYVTASRHLIHKVSLSDNRVVATVDVNRDGWERFVFGFSMAAGDRTAYAAMMSRRTERGEVVIGKPVVAEIDLATGKIVGSVEVPWGVARLVTVKGGRWVYALGKDLYKIDASGGAMKVTETMPMFDKKWNILPLWDYAWESGGMALMNYYTPEIMGLLTIDEKTGEIGDTPVKGDPILAYSVTFSPDRKTAYGVMDDLSVIDVVNKKYGPAVPLKEGTSYAVNLSADGKKIYVGAGGSTITIYDAGSLKPLKVLQMATDGMDLRRVTF
jgi:DNA-binding beta-propeller fold protein YncE